MSMKRLSLKAGMSESGIRDILNRNRSPSVDTFVDIAEALGVDPGWLLVGGDPRSLKLPLIGVVDSDEEWLPAKGLTIEVAGLDLQTPDLLAIEVRGNAMAPAYRDKDVVICQRHIGRYAHNLIGQDCAVLTTTGKRYFKQLKKGRTGVFNLKSFRALVDDIEGVAVEWVAPVLWIKRDRH